MIKNLLETKQGKYLFAATLLLVVTMIVSILIILSKPIKTEISEDSTENHVDIEEQIKIARSKIYSGIWYSDRDDEMIIEFLDDGAYRADKILSSGSYMLNEHQQIILNDENLGELTLDLETKLGRTIMRVSLNDESFYLYPDKKFMEEVLENYSHQEIVTENIVYQKWLDILGQGEWRTTSSEIEYSLVFYEDYYQQVKKSKDGEEEIIEVKFKLISQEIDENSCLFIINLLEGSRENIQFRITEESLIYELTSTPGSFLWQTSFEKLISEVELTQDGTTKADSEKISLEID
ncbi:hypothetical protein [Enterococcus sp. AZ012]|uniref:hypothetical protein n=1 Tax=unclassified Enterococcus TaxID=2608891 RepID=UPI003D28A43D